MAKIELLEVSIPKSTITRYRDLVIAGSEMIINSNILFYIDKSDLTKFLAIKNLKRNRNNERK